MLRFFILYIAGLMTLAAGALGLVLSSQSVHGVEMMAGFLLSTVLVLMGGVVAVDNAKAIHEKRKADRDFKKRWGGKLWVSNFD